MRKTRPIQEPGRDHAFDNPLKDLKNLPDTRFPTVSAADWHTGVSRSRKDLNIERTIEP